MRTSRYEIGTTNFAFDAEREARAQEILARYPEGKQSSATLAFLDLAQRQNGGHLNKDCVEYVAQRLEVAPIRVYEVASFYTMFYMENVGKYLIQVCRTTPCWLRGSDAILKACLDKLGVGKNQVTDDDLFSVVEVECLGACANAPMVQINDWYYEDLTPERMSAIIDDLKAGREVPIGPQTGRMTSAPEGGPQTLTSLDETGNCGTGDIPASRPAPAEEAKA